MTLLPQVKNQLDAAAHRQVRRRRGSPVHGLGWLPHIVPNLPVAFSGITAIAIAVLALTVLHGGGSRPAHPAQHRPTLTAPQSRPHPSGQPSPGQQAINAAINKAANQTVHSDHACQNENRGPTRVHGSPGQQLLSHLGVLRRPAIQSPTLQTLLGGGFSAGSRVYVDYIRLAQIAYGSAFYLIPEGNPSGLGPIPARCFTEMRARLKHLAAHLAPSQQTAALQQQAQNFRTMRQQTDRSGLCFAIVTTRQVRPPNGVNSGCGSTTAFLQPGLSGGIGQGDRAGGQIFGAVVPDGVAAVTLKFSASRTDPARTLTAQAINNVVVFKIPPHTAHADFPSEIIRRAANGQIISTTS